MAETGRYPAKQRRRVERRERAGTADVAAVFLDFGKIFVFEQKIFPNIEPSPATLGDRRREMASRNISGRIN